MQGVYAVVWRVSMHRMRQRTEQRVVHVCVSEFNGCYGNVRVTKSVYYEDDGSGVESSDHKRKGPIMRTVIPLLASVANMCISLPT